MTARILTTHFTRARLRIRPLDKLKRINAKRGNLPDTHGQVLQHVAELCGPGE